RDFAVRCDRIHFISARAVNPHSVDGDDTALRRHSVDKRFKCITPASYHVDSTRLLQIVVERCQRLAIGANGILSRNDNNLLNRLRFETIDWILRKQHRTAKEYSELKKSHASMRMTLELDLEVDVTARTVFGDFVSVNHG